VFPNPAKDHIQLVTESMNLITKCSFIDQSGTTILSVKPDNSIIDVSGLAQGFYILKIDFTMEPVWRKIIVIR
jgi:hypothetical protein